MSTTTDPAQSSMSRCATLGITTQVHNDGRLVATTTQTQSVLRP